MSSADGSTVADDPTEILNVSEDNSGPAAIDDTFEAAGKTGKPLATVTATLPNGVTTTITPTGTPALGVAESTTSTPPTSVPITTPAPRTTTVTPSGPRTVAGSTKKPKPKPKPSGTPTATRTVTSKPTPSDPPQTPTGGGGTNEQERKVLELSNAARQHEGCGPLRLDDSLVEAAGRHASDMVRRHYMDHTNPDGQGPGDRMAAAGFQGSSWGENIAAGYYDTAEEVFAAWMKSDGHRANIMNCKFNRIGIGFDPGQVKSQWGPGSWVQDFGRVGG